MCNLSHEFFVMNECSDQEREERFSAEQIDGSFVLLKLIGLWHNPENILRSRWLKLALLARRILHTRPPPIA
jgi:hypothetical protein